MYDNGRGYYLTGERPNPIRKTLWKCLKIFLIVIIIMLLLAVLILFVVIPLIFMYSVEVQRLVMFTNIGLPTSQKYYESFQEPGLKNFYVTINNEERNEIVSLGAWHFLPEPFLNKTKIDENFDYLGSLANTNYSVLLYFHGSGETRADLRKKCYKLRLQFHVIIFDYRDYADSTPSQLSEDAIVQDSIILYKWLQNKTNANIYIWGHSLGTPLSSNTIAHLKNSGIVPFGLILESPLTSMREEIPDHPYGKIFAWLPWFEATILNPLEKNGFLFNTINYILNVECPIMILHAEDDSIIPYTLGEKLYYYAMTQRNSTYGPVYYHQFSAKLGHDHFWIYEDKLFNTYIKKFMIACEDYSN